MTTTSEFLIADLVERTRQILNAAEHYKTFSNETLNWRPGEEKWSVLECLEHLNLYGDFYLPKIEQKMKNNSHLPAEKFSAGLLGDYFAKSMLPKKKLNKMKTFKDKNPLGSQLDKRTIDRFIDQQKQWLELLNRARRANLSKVKVPITISKWITLKLGDAFRFNIYHHQRHIEQARKVLEAEESLTFQRKSV